VITGIFWRIAPVIVLNIKKKLLFLLVIVGYRLHEHDFRTDVLCDLLDLKFPEMGGLNLDLPAGYGNNAILGGFNTLANFLALTHIDFHGFLTSIPHSHHQ